MKPSSNHTQIDANKRKIHAMITKNILIAININPITIMAPTISKNPIMSKFKMFRGKVIYSDG